MCCDGKQMMTEQSIAIYRNNVTEQQTERNNQECIETSDIVTSIVDPSNIN